MAKKKKEREAVVNEAALKAAQEAIPAGFEEQSADIDGFWDPTNPQSPFLHFVPMECRLSDSSIDRKKCSQLVIGKLVKPCELSTSDGVVVDGQPGDIVGVWAKPGMVALANLCGVEVYMYLDGYKDVKKASPMTTFAVMSRKRGEKIPVTRDSRVFSRDEKDPLGIVPGKARVE